MSGNHVGRGNKRERLENLQMLRGLALKPGMMSRSNGFLSISWAAAMAVWAFSMASWSTNRGWSGMGGAGGDGKCCWCG